MQQKISIVELYGTNVFNDAQMREHLPKKIYTELQHTIEEGAITEFSGKELIKGESDASSFPSGGLRATFEARGYTAWDCTSPAFLREDSAGVTLCIPTAFCSYTGEALDKKTPLLRSVEAINKQALRILRLFGNTTSKKINIYAGAEQEYFLIDRELYKQRKDLIFTGRTLFGAAPPKGQELDDHYFGSIKERIAKFMKELNVELWKMGVSAKTQHNEVAPAQHELALIYDTCNIATDHNQLVMKSMKRIASHHGLACLLHEKPFAGVNGSGKHNNWSMGTDDGQNLLDPGKTPHENAQFLLFLVAVIKAVDLHAALIRHSASNPGNDHRLGAGEAPPAIVSIFLGDQLTDIFEQIEHGEATSSIQGGKMKVGVNTLPTLKKDATDRNRTSPFAFTGNKFEFRMVPSSGSISGPNFILNTVVADVLKEFADELEKAEDFTTAVHELIHKTYVEHKRVIFNGNGYSEEWIEEAEKRGLPNLPTMVDAIPALTYDKTIETFERHKVLNFAELQSRAEIHYESYIKQINIEAKTMIDIASKQILPAVVKYKSSVASSLSSIKEVGGDTSVEQELLNNITENVKLFYQNLKILEQETEKAHHLQCSNHVAKAMEELRKPADELEMLVDEDIWPFPTYGELLFNI